MEYTQLRQPNLSIIGVEGFCLVYVREMFGVVAKYPTAASAWENAQYKHAGETPPNSIAAPLFFSYSCPDGHCATWDKGTIYSTSAQGDKTFTSIQELISYMGEGFKYLGWAQDINGVTVVEAIATPPPTVATPPAAASIFLPAAAGTWRIYKVGGPYTTEYALPNKLDPGDPKFAPGLTYPIEKTLAPYVYQISTEDFGTVAIYGGPTTIAQIKQG